MSRLVSSRAVAAAVCVYVAAYVVASWATGGRNLVLGDLAQLGPPALFAVLCFGAAARSERGARVFWNLNAWHGSLWVAAQSIWSYLELITRRPVGDASPTDPIFFAASMPIAAALYGRPDRHRPRWLFNVVVLDIVLITLFFVFIYLYTITALTVTNSPASLYAPSLTQLFNTRSIVLAVWAGWVFFSAEPGAWRRTLRLYFLGILAIGVGSAIANWAVDRGVYSTGSLYDLGWIAPYSLLAVVPAYALEIGAAAPARDAPPDVRPPLVSMAAVALLVGIPLTDSLSRVFFPASHELEDLRTQMTVTMVIPFGLVVLAREVVWRRALRRSGAALQTARAQLMQAEKLAAVGKLVSGMAHELNNPLQGVLGYAELMLAMPPDRRSGDEVQRIRENADRAASIVRNLLAFAGAERMSRAWLDVNHLVRGAIAERRPHFEAANIAVTFDGAERLPHVHVNTVQLQRVFVNVIANAEQAVRSASRARPEIRIETALDAPHASVDVVITDNGPGINPADLPRIFDPFFTTRDVGKGAGLGLSYCYGIVREHGGTIAAENSTGGARFIIRLPVGERAAARPAPIENRDNLTVRT
jgi:signal transduction histidine kinase